MDKPTPPSAPAPAWSPSASPKPPPGPAAGVRRRPDLGQRLVHRRQHRHERRRQEGRAVGHRPRQPGVVEDGHAGRQLAGGRAPRPQLRQDPRAADRQFRLRRFDAKPTSRSAKKSCHARPACRKDGLGRTSPTSSSAACPACRRKAPTALIVTARWVLHKMPPVTRTVCLEFFGQVREAVPAIVEITDYFKAGRRRSMRAGLLAGLEHLDERYVRRWATPPRPRNATAGPRWC